MEEVSESAIDAGAAVARQISRPHLGYLAIVSAVSVGAGAGIAWVVCKRHYEAKYLQLAEQEIAEARAFYAQLHKKDGFATPGEAVKSLGADGVEAANALERYQGNDPRPEVDVVVTTETVEVETKPVITNVFRESTPNDRWDQDEEIKKRESMETDEPYIISQEEYQEGELDYAQQTLTYFAEDDVLVDEKDQPINLIDPVVGEENMTRFGHGSNDNRIVYIRNDKLSMDFEVVKNEGSYSREVLGFQHADNSHRIRKFRGGDE